MIAKAKNSTESNAYRSFFDGKKVEIFPKSLLALSLVCNRPNDADLNGVLGTVIHGTACRVRGNKEEQRQVRERQRHSG